MKSYNTLVTKYNYEDVEPHFLVEIVRVTPETIALISFGFRFFEEKANLDKPRLAGAIKPVFNL